MPRWVMFAGLLFVAACNKSDTEETAEPTPEDQDEDGYEVGEDCDDADATVHPDAAELCNDVDDDCDQQIDEDVGDTFYTDGDADGFGDAAAPVTACELVAGLAVAPGDCDDTNEEINPNASETCNDIDDDCDDEIDEDSSEVWYADADGDGFGDPATEMVGCPEEGYVADDSDCDDLNGDVSPAADEICNGEDDDCNDVVDDNPVSGGDTWYADDDGDGYGDPAGAVTACSQPLGTVDNPDDCDDTTVEASPTGTEVCDGYDNDCNGVTDDEDALDAKTWYYDADGDGWGTDSRKVDACDAPSSAYVDVGGDCDDADATENPGVVWYADTDGDGYGDVSISVMSCVQPSGYVRNDDDCYDGDSSRSPAASEYCDGEDDDCDGTIDDSAVDAPTYYRDADGDGYGTSSTTQKACSKPTGYVSNSTDCLDSDATAYPGATEYCDSVDDDCDGTTDESSAVDAATWYKDNDGDGYGASTSGTTTGCSKPVGYSATNDDCNDTSATYSPATIWYYDSDNDGYGDSTATKTQCASPGSRWVLTSGDCRASDATSYPGATETCFSGSYYEGYDNDCDGSIDEGCPTLHCGTISSDETWTASNAHYVGCTVYVQGSTVPILTIEDGAKVYFGSGAGIYVGQSNYGDLVVEGTSSGVTFTSYKSSPAPGDWQGFYFGQYSTGSVIEGATIEYAQYYAINAYNSYFEMYDSTISDAVQYGMYLQGTDAVLDNVTVENNGTYGIYLYDSTVDITDSTLQGNGSYGLYCSYGDCFGSTFSNNTVTGNAYPLYVPMTVVPMLSSTSTYQGNTNDYVEIGYGTISSSATWQGIDVPYRVTNYIYVDGSSAPVLTLEDGVELQMSTGASLYIGCCSGVYKGDLVVNGTTKGVKITSASSSPTPGSYWFQIQNATSATKIQGLTVEYGYYGLYIGTDASLTIDDLTSRNNQYNGLYVSSYSSSRVNDLTLTNSTIESSGSTGFYFYGDVLSLDNVDVADSSSTGVYANAKTFSMKNSSVTGTSGSTDYAVQMSSDTSISTWSANTITDNDGYPLYLQDSAQMFKLDTASTYSGNGSDYVYVGESSLDTSGTIPGIDATYWFPYGLSIYKSGSTTPVVYASNADFRFGYDASYPYYQLYVGDAEFYATSCTFTGYGSSSAPRWAGIYFSSSTSTKGYVTSSDIGYAGYSGYNLYLGTKSVTATSSYIHHSSTYGVQCSGGCVSGGYTLTGNTYASNASGNTN